MTLWTTRSGRRDARVMAVAATLAAVVMAGSASLAFAYGKADQPLAQIEFSGNCNNPAYPLCAPPPDGFGLGGVWVWIEIDANQTGDVAGAGCGHIRGVGGGAGSIRGEITWWQSTGVPAGVMSFATDPNNQYYVVDFGDGPIAFPVTVGHYSFHPVPGVAIELQVAP